MDQATLWYVITVPIAAVSFIVSWFGFKKFQPVMNRPLLTGLLVNILIFSVVVGAAFMNVLVGISLMALLFPADSIWIWFMTQPATKKSRRIREKQREELEKMKRGKNE